MPKKTAAAEHLYKAGARLARGLCSTPKVACWMAENGLKARERVYVLEGFGEERAQILMAGGVSARSGRPFGRF